MSDIIKTPDAVVARMRPCIQRAAAEQPAKIVSQRAVNELAVTGLTYLLNRAAEATEPNISHQQDLIRAIARTRILVEKLTEIYCKDQTGATSFLFYLEHEARMQDPLRKQTG